jgi:hypothetical protein
VRRWLFLGLALALAAMAGRALLRFHEPGREPAPQVVGPPPPAAAHDEIDEASRQRLLESLREDEAP